MTISNSDSSNWVQLEGGPVPLRRWWSPPSQDRIETVSADTCKRAFIVLPEVFGVNGWVRGVGECLATHRMAALAMPLFARTAPALDLAYTDADLIEGRRHKDATTTDQILADLGAAIAWLQQRCPQARIDVVGFCFGGHAALLAATLPEVRASFDFYGAGVSRGRPGGGPPSLELLPQVQGRLTCVCGTADPLIPTEDRNAIQNSLALVDPSGQRLRYLEICDADHGFMCESRSSFNAEASAQGWSLLLD